MSKTSFEISVLFRGKIRPVCKQEFTGGYLASTEKEKKNFFKSLAIRIHCHKDQSQKSTS